MLVTALNLHVGYESAAKIAKIAHNERLSLKEAAVKLNIFSEDEFEKIVNLSNMIYPNG